MKSYGDIDFDYYSSKMEPFCQSMKSFSTKYGGSAAVDIMGTLMRLAVSPVMKGGGVPENFRLDIDGLPVEDINKHIPAYLQAWSEFYDDAMDCDKPLHAFEELTSRVFSVIEGFNEYGFRKENRTGNNIVTRMLDVENGSDLN